MTDHPRHYAFPHDIPPAPTGSLSRNLADVAYAHVSQAQRLDLFWPAEGDGPFPVIVAIHGGAFMGGDKGDEQLTPMLAGLKRGYVVASINYRMSGEACFPALIHDVKAAIRWLRAHSVEHRLDASRIAVWGGSAGGYLALMAGLTANQPELEDLGLGAEGESCAVQAVVDWFGPTDFLKMDAQLAESGLAPRVGEEHNGPRSPESLILGRPITTAPELVRAANPESYVHIDAPPFLIQHGLSDPIVPHQQSTGIAALLSAVLGPERVTLDLLPGAGHADPAFLEPANLQRVFAFLDRHLKRS